MTKETLKLLIVIDDLRYGGAQRQVVELARNLNKNDLEVTVAVYHPRREYLPELEARGVSIEYIPKKFKYSPVFFLRFTYCIAKLKPDLIHSFLQTPNFWARVCGQAGGCRKIVTSVRNSRFPFAGMERPLSKLCRKIIVNSSVTAEKLKGLGVAPNKLVVIRNGVDLVRFNPSLRTRKNQYRQEFGIAADRMVFSLVGKFERQKNHDCLITALALLKNTGKVQPQTVFVGENYDPGLKVHLESRAVDLGLDDVITFLEPTTSVERVYGMSDVIVLPSQWEGCANAVLEAFASGVPVLCSDIPENREIVRDGQTGFLFENNNPDQLATGIAQIMEMNPKTLVDAGVAAREYAEQHFSLSRMVDDTTAVYAELIGF